jgi:hypothetical protein
MSNIYLSLLSTAGKPRDDDVFFASDSTSDAHHDLGYLDWNVRWLLPGNFVNGSWNLASINNLTPCLFRTNSSDASGTISFDVSAWGAGTLMRDIYYTGTVSSAGLINFQDFANGWTSTIQGVDATANSTVYFVNNVVDIAGPATASQLQVHTTSMGAFPSGVELLTVRFRSTASAGETYTGDIQVIAVKYYLDSSST